MWFREQHIVHRSPIRMFFNPGYIYIAQLASDGTVTLIWHQLDGCNKEICLFRWDRKTARLPIDGDVGEVKAKQIQNN